MNLLQFIASIFDSLVWPATVIILIVLLRKPVTRVLMALSKLKYKDLELDFGKEVKQLERKAKEINISPSKENKSLPSKKKDSLRLLSEAEGLVQKLPKVSVVLAWSGIEDELMLTISRLAISPDYSPDNSYLKNAKFLAKENVIDDETLDLIKRMRNLRNIAVHDFGDLVDVPSNEALEYLFIAKGLIEKLRGLNRD